MAVSFIGGGLPGVNHRPVVCHWQTLSHYVVSRTHHLRGIWIHNSDCIGSCKSNYYTITTTMAALECDEIIFLLCFLSWFHWSRVDDSNEATATIVQIGWIEATETRVPIGWVEVINESFTVVIMPWLIITEYLCHKGPRICSVVVNTIRSFPQLIKGFVTRVTLRVPLVEYELFSLPDHLCTTRILAGFVLLDH